MAERIKMRQSLEAKVLLFNRPATFPTGCPRKEHTVQMSKYSAGMAQQLARAERRRNACWWIWQ